MKKKIAFAYPIYFFSGVFNFHVDLHYGSCNGLCMCSGFDWKQLERVSVHRSADEEVAPHSFIHFEILHSNPIII